MFILLVVIALVGMAIVAWLTHLHGNNLRQAPVS
jgi:hypothetical protein